jgi:hypothetical protein
MNEAATGFFTRVKVDVPPPFEHQTTTTQFILDKKHCYIGSDPGCVSADTEFLTPTGWKRIDEYAPGDLVAQFHPDTKAIELVEPLSYVKRPCDKFIAIAPARGTSQRLSHEHRVLFYRLDGTWAVEPAHKFAESVRATNHTRLNKRFACTFAAPKTSGLPYTDDELRLLVAIIADGTFPRDEPGSLRCTFRLKKARKQQRLRQLLTAVGGDWTVASCRAVEGFERFRCFAPARHKEFVELYWGASPAQLRVITDELPHWDSCIDSRGSQSFRFSTSSQRSADFAQYALAACGITAALSSHTRFRRGRSETEYVVHARRNGGLVGPGKAKSTYEVANPEGYKYCFEVPTGFLLLRHNGYIFATGNTGKTRSCLDAISELRASAIVLAPKAILEPAWVNDARQFTPHLTAIPCYAEKRKEAFERKADIHITNHDAVKWLADNPWSFKDKQMLIIDEATAYKNKDAKRSRAVLKIADYFEYVVLMCGTPMPQGLEDLWHQFLILDGGERLGKSFYAFRNATYNSLPTPFGISKWEEKEGAREVVADLISDAFIRFELEQCIDMPEKIERTLTFTLPLKLRKLYDDMVKQAILEMEEGEITAVNAASLLTKLLQIASGSAYSVNGEALRLDSARAGLVAQLCAERDHSLVAFQWTHQRDEIVAELANVGISRDEIAIVDGSFKGDIQQLVNDFQAGKYRVLLAHPKSASHGLTLTKATTTIWASPTYELERFQQFNRRTYRAGQKQRTEFIFIAAEDTVDEKAYARLFEKAGAQEDLISLLKSLAG